MPMAAHVADGMHWGVHGLPYHAESTRCSKKTAHFNQHNAARLEQAQRAREASCVSVSRNAAVPSTFTTATKARMAKKRRGTGDQQLASAEEHAVKSESLFEAKQYADAALEAEKALQCLPLMARSSLTRGRALLYPALSKMVQEGGLPPAGLLEEAGRHFTLAVRLDPECEEAKGEVDSLQKLLSDLPQDPAPASAAGKEPSGAAAAVDVIIVGAGAAGVGCALMLTKTFGLDASRVLLIERGEGVGDTFRRWPAEMRFISPSFNNQGWTNSFDLNSVAHGSSPAYAKLP